MQSAWITILRSAFLRRLVRLGRSSPTGNSRVARTSSLLPQASQVRCGAVRCTVHYLQWPIHVPRPKIDAFSLPQCTVGQSIAPRCACRSGCNAPASLDSTGCCIYMWYQREAWRDLQNSLHRHTIAQNGQRSSQSVAGGGFGLGDLHM